LNISSAIAELGTTFRYENLRLWSSINNIPVATIKKEIAFALEKGLMQVYIELRCPYCGAHLGDFHKPEEIPKEIKCTDCAHSFNRSVLLQNIELVFSLTDYGKSFFRNILKRTAVENAKGSIESFVLSLFR